MIIVFEGADNTGKTNIAHELAKVLSGKVLKGDKELKIFNSEHCRELPYIVVQANLHLLKQLDIEYPLILDRATASQWVYSRVYGRWHDDTWHQKTEQMMVDLNTIMIYCYKTAYKEFDDPLVSFDKIAEIKDTYDKYLEITPFPYMTLNTTNENLKQQISEILKYLCAAHSLSWAYYYKADWS